MSKQETLRHLFKNNILLFSKSTNVEIRQNDIQN